MGEGCSEGGPKTWRALESPDRPAQELIYDPSKRTAAWGSSSRMGDSPSPVLPPAPRSPPSQKPLQPTSAPRIPMAAGSPGSLGLETGNPSPDLGKLSNTLGGASGQRWRVGAPEPPGGQASAASGHRAGRQERRPENALSQPQHPAGGGLITDSCPSNC